MTGTIVGGGTFRGVLDVRQFAARNGELVANGVLNGTLTNALGRTTPVVNQAVPVRIAQITGTCRILHLVLGPLDLDLLGLRIQLSRVVLDITAQRGPGRLLGNLLCAIAGLLDRRPLPLAAIANRINSLVQLSRLLSNVPVNGAGGGNRFGGTLDIERFVTRNGRLMAQGAISGVLRDANGTVVDTVTRSPVLLQIAQIRGTCRILRLVLGPLDLNLLGLRIQLNRVVLNITARRGPGRLLGNLLCAIAGLLDRNAPTGAVANQLNRLVVLRP